MYLNLTDFNDRELANLMWSLAVLGQQPHWLMDNLLSCSATHFDAYSASSLHLVAWSLGRLGYAPSEPWLRAFMAAAQANFFKFTPSELANVIWALARMGVELPSMWLDNFLMVAQWRFPSFGARQLSIVAWSAATLGHRPQQDWLLCFEEQVRAGVAQRGMCVGMRSVAACLRCKVLVRLDRDRNACVHMHLARALSLAAANQQRSWCHPSTHFLIDAYVCGPKQAALHRGTVCDLHAGQSLRAI